MLPNGRLYVSESESPRLTRRKKSFAFADVYRELKAFVASAAIVGFGRSFSTV